MTVIRSHKYATKSIRADPHFSQSNKIISNDVFIFKMMTEKCHNYLFID